MAHAEVVEEEMEQVLQFVAKTIGGNWRWLGRELKVSNSFIQGIDEEVKCPREKAYQVLLKWFQTNGKAGATKEILAKALIAIEQTFIAEKLGFNDLKCGKACQEFPQTPSKSAEDLPSSIQEQCKSPETKSPINTTSGNHLVFDKFEIELDAMLKDCINNLVSCNRPALAHNLKILQHMQTLNNILVESKHEHPDGRLEEIEKSRGRRIIQTDQTQRLILKLLEERGPKISNKKNKTTEPRPASEVLHTSTSEVNLQRRSDTFSFLTRDKMDISPPISTSQHNLLSRTESREPSSTLSIDRICEDEHEESAPSEAFDEKPQPFPRCESCGSCINTNIERPPSRASEDQEPISYDENCYEGSSKTAETTTGDIKEDAKN